MAVAAAVAGIGIGIKAMIDANKIKLMVWKEEISKKRAKNLRYLQRK